MNEYKVIESIKEPDKSAIWLKDGKLLHYTPSGWQVITPEGREDYDSCYRVGNVMHIRELVIPEYAGASDLFIKRFGKEAIMDLESVVIDSVVIQMRGGLSLTVPNLVFHLMDVTVDPRSQSDEFPNIARIFTVNLLGSEIYAMVSHPLELIGLDPIDPRALVKSSKLMITTQLTVPI